MAYKSLYRSYRPQQFSEVIGQQHIVVTLKNAIKRDQLAHAYLFTGSRGTGKTTIAKLLAKGINCLHPEKAPCNECEMCLSINQESHPDIIEIDAASNNGVDDVRDLIERVKYAPLIAKKKVYIIDEVHMLSTGAFNALLKTLEEPPEHVVFILATTEVHKVLPTIISRCQRYDFTRISNQDIIQNLNRVIKAEELEVEDGVVETIANLADGGHRDSLTILEQVIAYSQHPITINDLVELYRISKPEDKKELLQSLFNQDLLSALELLKSLDSKSIDYHRYLFDMITLCKEILVYSMTQNEDLVSNLNKKTVVELSQYRQDDLLLDFVNKLIEIAAEARLNGQYRSYLEVALLNLIKSEQPINVIMKEMKDVVQTQAPAVEVKVEETSKEEPPKEKKSRKAKVVEDVLIEQPEALLEETEEQETTKISEPVETKSLIKQLYIQLMVLGDKAKRVKDSALWENREDYLNNFKYRRLNFLLNPSEIGVSNSDFVVLIVASQNEVMALKEETNSKLLDELVEEMLEARKVYVLDAPTYKEMTNEFRELYQNNELPLKEEIKIDFSKEKLNVVKEKDPQTLLEEVFGEIRIEE